MRFKKTTWFDTIADKPAFGFKIFHNGYGFLNAAENGKPLLFDTEKERDDKIKSIKTAEKEGNYLKRSVVTNLLKDRPFNIKTF